MEVRLRGRTYDLDAPRDIAQMVARERYAWPGGYVMGAVTSDGGLLCPSCTWTEYRLIRESQRDAETYGSSDDGWNVVGWTHAGQADDHHQLCDHCGAEMVTW